jgi:CBS domain containing-hemolysin-like protein
MACAPFNDPAGASFRSRRGAPFRYDLTMTMMAVAIALVLLNGFFVAAEFAIVKLRRTRAEELAETAGMRGRVLLSVRTHLDGYLSACQLGITAASLGLGWIGEPAFARVIEPLLASVSITSERVVGGISFAIAFGLISFLHIVIGEQAPKSLAIRETEAISLWSAPILWLFYRLMFPFIWILNGSALILLRVLGVRLEGEGEEAHSSDELKQAVLASHLHGELDPTETAILQHGLELGELTVGDVMQPFADLVTIDVDAPIDEILELIRRSRYSRYAVYEGDRTNLIGLLHIKDLITAEQRLRDIRDLRPYLRELPRVDEDMDALDLLALFRTGTPHLASVQDAVGTVIGFVTMEQVLEALVGPIEDEFRRELTGWLRRPDGTLLGRGSLSIVSLEHALGREIDFQEANSVGGMVQWALRRLPLTGDRVEFDGFAAEVLRMRGPRVHLVRIDPRADVRRAQQGLSQ